MKRPTYRNRIKKTPRSIDFKSAAHDELDEYGMQTLIYDTPELSVVLRGHMLIEQVIETLISHKMKFPEKFFGNHRVTFEMKVDLAASLGVLPAPHLGAAKALNSIRNSYAHREDHRTSIEELNSFKIAWTSDQKKAYALACGKGLEDAMRIAMIFLNWSFFNLLPKSTSAKNDFLFLTPTTHSVYALNPRSPCLHRCRHRGQRLLRLFNFCD